MRPSGLGVQLNQARREVASFKPTGQDKQRAGRNDIGDGHEFDEYVVEAVSAPYEYRAIWLQVIFREFDYEGDGTVDKKELYALGTARRSVGQKRGTWTEEDNMRLLQKIDLNGDGLIQEAEFIKHFDLALSHLAQTEFQG